MLLVRHHRRRPFGRRVPCRRRCCRGCCGGCCCGCWSWGCRSGHYRRVPPAPPCASFTNMIDPGSRRKNAACSRSRSCSCSRSRSCCRCCCRCCSYFRRPTRRQRRLQGMNKEVLGVERSAQGRGVPQKELIDPTSHHRGRRRRHGRCTCHGGRSPCSAARCRGRSSSYRGFGSSRCSSCCRRR